MRDRVGKLALRKPRPDFGIGSDGGHVESTAGLRAADRVIEAFLAIGLDEPIDEWTQGRA